MTLPSSKWVPIIREKSNSFVNSRTGLWHYNQVGKAHLEGFGSFEGVIKTKGELYDFLRKKGNSTIFIHHDNPYLMNIAKGLNLFLMEARKIFM